ncbi:MAG: class I SAM-dependent methyltransferase [TACK group archaeon]|nr:class I SAM-dependent methyltransferase [TACK group archaeon]
MDGVNFGVYHHTSAEGSTRIRKAAEAAFVDASSRIGLDASAKISVLDAGSGLGFLTFVTASHFCNATVTAMDSFEGKSLPGNSLDTASRNLKAPGIWERVDLVVSDLSVLGLRGGYDLAVSNPVFHNLRGRRRRKAYEAVALALRDGSHFLDADLFIGTNLFFDPPPQEMRRMADLFSVDFVLTPSAPLRGYRLIGFRKNAGFQASFERGLPLHHVICFA